MSSGSPAPTVEASTFQNDHNHLDHNDNDKQSELGPAKEFFFIPIPAHLRYDPSKPFHFGIVLNIAFGFTSTFSQPLLPLLSS